MSKHKKVKAWAVVIDGMQLDAQHDLFRTRMHARNDAHFVRHEMNKKCAIHKAEIRILPNRKAR